MTTTCPDLGTWRAVLDGEDPGLGSDEHLATCADCALLVARLRGDATFARQRLAVLAAPTSTLPPATAAPTDLPRPAGQVPRRRRTSWLGGVVAAAAAGVVLVTPVGQQSAEAVLSVFRVEQFSIIPATTQQLVDAAGVLSSLGTVDSGVDGWPAPDPVSVAEAERTTGLDVPEAPSLEGRPSQAFVIPASKTRWTLDEDAIRDYLRAENAELAIPDGLDGTTLVLDRADAVAALYGATMTSPDVAVAVSGPVTLDVVRSSLSLAEVRTFLLSLPGLPDALVSQLAAIDDWRTTLPLPIPVDEASVATVQLGGTEVVSVEVDGAGTAYVWAEDGTSSLVVGPTGSGLAKVVAGEIAP